jgi:hypothetical protein
MNEIDWTRLESFISELAKMDNSFMYVVTGALYDLDFKYPNELNHFPLEEIGSIGEGCGRIAVPTHFYKVIQLNQPHIKAASAFVIPNTLVKQQYPLSAFEVAVSLVQESAGNVDFTAFNSANTKSVCDVEANACMKEYSNSLKLLTRYRDWLDNELHKPKHFGDFADLVRHAISDNIVHLKDYDDSTLTDPVEAVLASLKEGLLKSKTVNSPHAVNYCAELEAHSSRIDHDKCIDLLSSCFQD